MTKHTSRFRTHRFRATVLVGLARLGILLALYGCGGNADPSPSTQFTLSGQVNCPATFTRADLRHCSRASEAGVDKGCDGVYTPPPNLLLRRPYHVRTRRIRT